MFHFFKNPDPLNYFCDPLIGHNWQFEKLKLLQCPARTPAHGGHRLYTSGTDCWGQQSQGRLHALSLFLVSAPYPSPAGTHSIVRMEDIGGWRVIQNEHPPKVSAQTAQVLHVVPPVEDTRLPEQTCPEGPPLVQQVSHWVCILGDGRWVIWASKVPQRSLLRGPSSCMLETDGRRGCLLSPVEGGVSPWRGWR